MEWKTFSVEAGDGFSKQTSGTHERQSRAFPNPAKFFPLDGSVFDSGMQKDGLTMFRSSCYSCWVPRVHPGLLCAVSSARLCGRFAAELLRNTFPV
jgi:hypothetical protein